MDKKAVFTDDAMLTGRPALRPSLRKQRVARSGMTVGAVPTEYIGMRINAAARWWTLPDKGIARWVCISEARVG